MKQLLAVLLLAAPLLRGASGDPVRFHEARVEARPGDGDALRMLANTLVARAELSGDGRDYDRAAEMLDRADMLDPWFAPNVASRCRLLLSRHRFLAARSLAEEALRRFPEHGEFLEVAGDAALEMGDLDGAERLYERLHRDATGFSSWARLAHVAELRGNWELARERQRKAVEAANHARAWARAVLGEIELKLGDAAAAREQYRLGLLDTPEHPLVLEHLAELEQIKGKTAAAIDAYRRILAQRRDPAIELRLARLVGGEEAAGLRKKATAFIEQAVSTGNEGYLRPLAELRLEEGEYENAVRLQVRDVLLRPTSDACEVLSRIHSAASASGRPVEESGSGICVPELQPKW